MEFQRCGRGTGGHPTPGRPDQPTLQAGPRGVRGRRLLSAGVPIVPSPPAVTQPSAIPLGTLLHATQDLNILYRAYQQDPTDVSGFAAEFPSLQFRGDKVAIGVKAGEDFGGLLTSLDRLGMQVIASSDFFGVVDGYVTIDQLPAVAALPQTSSLHSLGRPLIGPPVSPPLPLPPPPPPIRLPPPGPIPLRRPSRSRRSRYVLRRGLRVSSLSQAPGAAGGPSRRCPQSRRLPRPGTLPPSAVPGPAADRPSPSLPGPGIGTRPATEGRSYSLTLGRSR